MKVYKHTLEDGGISFTIHHNCVQAERLLISMGLVPKSLVDFRDVDNVTNAPNEVMLWKIIGGKGG